MNIIGTYINYYFHCKKQLWLASRYINMEQESEDVKIGKLLTENAYSREKHEIEIIDEFERTAIKIDFIDKNKIIHEIKKSKKIDKSHEFQLLYYIYIFKSKKINTEGIINYPKIRKKINVKLTNQKEKELKKALNEIDKIINSNKVPIIKRSKVCSNCSYNQLCNS